MKNCIIPWNEDYLKYTFPNHSFSSEKYKFFIQKVNSCSFSSAIRLIEKPIDWKYLKQAIDKKHLKRLKNLSDTGIGFLDPGTPVFKDMLLPARLSAQGTYLSITEVISGNYKFAFNCLGGFHHATPRISRGGCIINDMGVAIKRIRREGIKSKIAILDFDFHPHDGTIAYFGGDSSVFLASIHEAGWFDHDDDEIGWEEGINTVCNWGIKRAIEPHEYLKIVKDKLIPATKEFDPEIIIFLNGVDAHVDDPVVQKYPSRAISLEDDHFKILAELISDLALEVCEGKIIGLGAGGYSSEIASRIWFQTVKIFSQKI